MSTKNKKKDKSGMSLFLKGSVYVIEHNSKGRIISESEIPGDVVLRIIHGALENGIRLLEEEMRSQPDFLDELEDELKRRKNARIKR